MQETTTKKKAAPKATKATPEHLADMSELVQVRAYFLAEQAGFEAGRDMDFWLQAESETLASLAPAKPARVRKPRVKKDAEAIA